MSKHDWDCSNDPEEQEYLQLLPRRGVWTWGAGGSGSGSGLIPFDVFPENMPGMPEGGYQQMASKMWNEAGLPQTKELRQVQQWARDQAEMLPGSKTDFEKMWPLWAMMGFGGIPHAATPAIPHAEMPGIIPAKRAAGPAGPISMPQIGGPPVQLVSTLDIIRRAMAQGKFKIPEGGG